MVKPEKKIGIQNKQEVYMNRMEKSELANKETYNNNVEYALPYRQMNIFTW